MKLYVYIAGPISGMPEGNEPAFRAAAERLEAAGHVVHVPFDIGAWPHENEPCPTGYTAERGHSSACWLRGDLVRMLLDCDAIYCLRGWERSRGASLEHRVAVECGLTVLYELESDLHD